MPAIDIEVMDLASAAQPSLLDPLVEMYAAVFGPPPWNEGADRVAAFRDRLIRDAAIRTDGRLAVARDGQDLVGFATAWTTPSPFPADRAYGTVAEILPAAVVDDRLAGRREIDELAIHPLAQRRGLGRRLLGAIAPAGTPSWLLTSPTATAALDFYRAIGWEELTPTPAPLAVFASPLDHR